MDVVDSELQPEQEAQKTQPEFGQFSQFGKFDQFSLDMTSRNTGPRTIQVKMYTPIGGCPESRKR